MSSAGAAAWNRAILALDLLAIDPGLGGLVLRARAGAVRDGARQAAEARLGPFLRIAPGMAEDHVFGGLDPLASLAAGRPVRRSGLVEDGRPLILAMAERAPPALAARLGQAVEAGTCLIALDEGSEEERIPPVLAGRLAFDVDLGDVAYREVRPEDCEAQVDAAAGGSRSAMAVRLSDADLRALVVVAEDLGIADGRALGLTLRCAQAHAARAGRTEATVDDLAIAAQLVLAPRATRLPMDAAQRPQSGEADGPPPERGSDAESEAGSEGSEKASGDAILENLPDDVLVAAARAAIPPRLLEQLAARRARGVQAARAGAGTGNRRAGHRRGRPLPSRPGPLDGRSRIDLGATLRRAAPWQGVRRLAEPRRTGLILRPSDIVLRRVEEVSDRVLVFLVDASGSAALARLAEVKGAVELMLGTAYARRDHVALVTFRGHGAETLLGPTRSLTRAKRRLAGLAGGGGTPLAAGLAEGLALARAAAGQGMTPSLVLLSDGHANVAMDGTANRTRAEADTLAVARVARAAGLGWIVIDTGQRPSRSLAALALALDAGYLALPRVGAKAIRAATLSALGV